MGIDRLKLSLNLVACRRAHAGRLRFAQRLWPYQAMIEWLVKIRDPACHQQQAYHQRVVADPKSTVVAADTAQKICFEEAAVACPMGEASGERQVERREAHFALRGK